MLSVCFSDSMDWFRLGVIFLFYFVFFSILDFFNFYLDPPTLDLLLWTLYSQLEQEKKKEKKGKKKKEQETEKKIISQFLFSLRFFSFCFLFFSFFISFQLVCESYAYIWILGLSRISVRNEMHRFLFQTGVSFFSACLIWFNRALLRRRKKHRVACDRECR